MSVTDPEEKRKEKKVSASICAVHGIDEEVVEIENDMFTSLAGKRDHSIGWLSSGTWTDVDEDYKPQQPK